MTTTQMTIRSDGGALGTIEFTSEIRLTLDKGGHASGQVDELNCRQDGLPEGNRDDLTPTWSVRMASIKPLLDALGSVEIAKRLAPLLDEVHDGHAIEWDDHTCANVGVLSENADNIWRKKSSPWVREAIARSYQDI